VHARERQGAKDRERQALEYGEGKREGKGTEGGETCVCDNFI